jgi:hypothetical protein
MIIEDQGFIEESGRYELNVDQEVKPGSDRAYKQPLVGYGWL